jgi:hypothetical protein
MVIGKMTIKKDRAVINLIMETNTKVNGIMIENKVKEHLIFIMEISMWVNLKILKWKEKVLFYKNNIFKGIFTYANGYSY